MKTHSERGSAIIMLFVAVALFGLVAFAFLQGSRGNLNMITSEASKAEGYKTQDCANTTNMAVKRLEARGCTGMISYREDGSNTIAGAPTDGSCSVYHPNGGGVKACTSVDETCMRSLIVGQSCAGVVYIGISGGRRIYANPTDSAPSSWNNGTATWGFISTSESDSDGLSNTDALLAEPATGAPFAAAQACRALGSKWYLPARDELALLRSVKDTGDFAGTFQLSGYMENAYWTSVSQTSTNANYIFFADGVQSYGDRRQVLNVRCVRRD